MDYVINFVMSLAGYFILSVFIYNIAGRKRKISLIILSVFTLIETYQVIQAALMGVLPSMIILLFVARVLPLLLAFFFFMSFTGGLPLLKFKFRKKLKNFNTDIQTKKKTFFVGLSMIIGSIVLILLAYYFIEDILMFVVMGLSLISFGFGIYFILMTQKISEEKVILLVGREKEHIYGFNIPKDKLSLTVKDFFKNDRYIVDAIGEIEMIHENKSITKHYLFWIATGDKVDMTGEDLSKISRLSYQDFLGHFEKYHYKKVWFMETKMGNLELIKEKQIK